MKRRPILVFEPADMTDISKFITGLLISTFPCGHQRVHVRYIIRRFNFHRSNAVSRETFSDEIHQSRSELHIIIIRICFIVKGITTSPSRWVQVTNWETKTPGDEFWTIRQAPN